MARPRPTDAPCLPLQLPTRIPSRLTYRISSDPIYITIPEPDAKLTIRLHGAGLTFDPPVLTFANTSRVSFRVTGASSARLRSSSAVAQSC